MSLWTRFRFWLWKKERQYKRWARKVQQSACPHVFIVTVSWTGSRKMCLKCHLTKDFMPWN